MRKTHPVAGYGAFYIGSCKLIRPAERTEVMLTVRATPSPAFTLSQVVSSMREILTGKVADTALAVMSAADLLAEMDDHAPHSADDHAEALSEIDPSILCDRFGDWCEFPNR